MTVLAETKVSDGQKFSRIHRDSERTAAKVAVELITRIWEDKYKILERREQPKRVERKRRASTDNHGVEYQGLGLYKEQKKLTMMEDLVHSGEKRLV